MTFWPNVSLYALGTLFVSSILYLTYHAFAPGPMPTWSQIDPLVKWWFGGLVVIAVLALLKAETDHEKFWENR